MASEHSRKLMQFNSKWHSPNTKAVDCFTQNWNCEINYICAPLNLLNQIFQHIFECQATSTIIVPEWVLALWWLILVNSNYKSLPLPNSTAAFTPALSGYLEPLNNPSWKFLAV